MALSGTQSLEQLKGLIKAMREALDAVHAANPTLDASAETFDELEDEAEDAISALDRELDGFGKELESANEDAVDEVEKVEKAARQGADDRLAEAKEDVDEAETRFTADVKSAVADLDEADRDLTVDGFGTLASALDGVEEALRTSQARMETGFDEADGEVTQAAARFKTEAAGVGGKLAEADAQADQDNAGLATAAGGAKQTMDAATNTATQTLSAWGDTAKTVYENVETQATTDADNFISSVKGTLQDTADLIRNEQMTPMDTALQAVQNEQATPLTKEIGEVATCIWTAQSAGMDLEPLVADLERCKQVVDQIEKLLKSMD
jgi:chromosome segregation ATPase